MSAPPKVSLGAALTYAMQVLGGPLVEIETFPTLTATLSVAVDANGDRVGLLFMNNDAGNDVYIGLGPTTANQSGIKIGASGGFLSLDVTKDFTLPSRRWYGVCNGGANSIYVLQLVRVSYGGAR